jgi:hypothetical protein
LNSVEFKDFKTFIFQLKKMNSEYIKYKKENKTVIGKSKNFSEFIEDSIIKLNKSGFSENDQGEYSGNLVFLINLKRI